MCKVARRHGVWADELSKALTANQDKFTIFQRDHYTLVPIATWMTMILTWFPGQTFDDIELGQFYTVMDIAPPAAISAPAPNDGDSSSESSILSTSSSVLVLEGEDEEEAVDPLLSFATTMQVSKTTPKYDKGLIQPFFKGPFSANLADTIGVKDLAEGKFGLVWKAASGDDEETQAVVCLYHCKEFGPSYIKNKDGVIPEGAVPHHFCWKDKDAEWDPKCARIIDARLLAKIKHNFEGVYQESKKQQKMNK